MTKSQNKNRNTPFNPFYSEESSFYDHSSSGTLGKLYMTAHKNYNVYRVTYSHNLRQIFLICLRISTLCIYIPIEIIQLKNEHNKFIIK